MRWLYDASGWIRRSMVRRRESAWNDALSAFVTARCSEEHYLLRYLGEDMARRVERYIRRVRRWNAWTNEVPRLRDKTIGRPTKALNDLDSIRRDLSLQAEHVLENHANLVAEERQSS